MNTPNVENYFIGAGNAMFDRLVDGKRSGLRHLGNVTSFEITPKVTNLDHHSSMVGGRPIDKRIAVEIGAAVSMVLEEIESKNLALAALGIEAAVTQASGTATDVSINGGVALNFDVWYMLNKPTTHDLGVLNPTITSVKQGATVLVLDTDYEKDEESGMIRLLSSGAAAPDVAATWTGTIPAITAEDGLRDVKALEATNITGYLFFKSATDQKAGKRLQVECWRVEISSEAATQLISEEFATITLNAECLVDMSRPEGNRYYKITELSSVDIVPDEETA